MQRHGHRGGKIMPEGDSKLKADILDVILDYGDGKCGMPRASLNCIMQHLAGEHPDSAGNISIALGQLVHDGILFIGTDGTYVLTDMGEKRRRAMRRIVSLPFHLQQPKKRCMQQKLIVWGWPYPPSFWR